jgi:hypothetical protein
MCWPIDECPIYTLERSRFLWPKWITRIHLVSINHQSQWIATWSSALSTRVHELGKLMRNGAQIPYESERVDNVKNLNFFASRLIRSTTYPYGVFCLAWCSAAFRSSFLVAPTSKSPCCLNTLSVFTSDVFVWAVCATISLKGAASIRGRFDRSSRGAIALDDELDNMYRKSMKNITEFGL